MTRKNGIVLLILLAIFGFALYTILPVDSERFGRKGLRLGLDLIGGVHLVYQADFSANATEQERKNDLDRAVITIQKRIDKYGVTEPIIQTLGSDRIMVQLPGFTDIEAAKSLVEQTGFLEFKEVEVNDSGLPVYLSDYLSDNFTGFFDTSETDRRVFVADYVGNTDENYGSFICFLVKAGEGLELEDTDGNPIDAATLPENAEYALSWIPARGDDGTQLDGDLLADAYASIDQSGIAPTPEVAIEWDSEGAVIFDEIALRLYNSADYGTPQRALGIFLDNSLLSAPQIKEAAYQGKGVITGDFTLAQVEELANLLKSGSLPMPLKKTPLYQEKVSATLGANFIQITWMAGLIGIILVMLFMIAYYRLPGLLASLALVFYGALVLAVFKLVPVTLTLAGIGGFVVSLGMAVDANVLIFERMKEELRTGRTLGAAIEAGFKRAWSAILDSNVTTVIACIILIWLASSVVASAQVMGFALTLLIGVLVSMFTAIVVTRTLLRLFVTTSLARNISLFSAYWRKK